ncbi:cytochrome P450 [Dactylonectria macrodidyma]|uniref:Cytochrome P450 n=1 Tax=Dactylonectria macrodidyma TaxID=307937 RepID=A0A9P9JDI6_9HYPO|nr:cytochrome P450 [Dactylonectria macrodidyma]
MSNSNLGYFASPMTQLLLVQCLDAAISGFLAHGFYFIHWTDDRNAMRVVLGHALAFFMLAFLEIAARGVPSGLQASFFVYAAYLTTLFTIITIYRLFFHRLRRFPGPVWASITKAYGVYASRDGKLHEGYNWLLHLGLLFASIRSSEILHNAIDSMTQVRGWQSKCAKGNFYATMEYGHQQVLNPDAITDKTEHRFRRQIWDKAFKGKAIDAREQPIRDVIHQRLAKVDELKGQPLNGPSSPRSFHSTSLQPWLITLSKKLPLADSSDLIEFENLARRLVAQRLKDSEAKEDIIHYFIEDYKSKEPKAFFTQERLECDAQAILIGAADSSFSLLSFCFHHLILSPGTIDTLRAELSPFYNCSHREGFANADLTRSAPFLHAVINETMRLYSPACTNGVKKTPPEGIALDGTYIPGHVNLISSIWSFHRSECYFVRLRDWIPERWTKQPELVLDKRAYHPFSTGQFETFPLLRWVISEE